jgi:hypothetical protein
MRRRAFAIAALASTLAATAAGAAPLIFEETAKISPPDPAFTFPPLHVAVEGDAVIAIWRRTEWTLEPYEHDRSHYAAFLFQRQSNGNWAYVRTLAQQDCDEGELAEDTCPMSVAIRNGVAAVSGGGLHIFRRAVNGDWIAAPSDAFAGPGDVAVGSEAIVASAPVCIGLGVKAFRPNSAGVWSQALSTIPQNGGCDDWGLLGKDVDISVGNRLIGAFEWPAAASIFEPTSTGWTEVATLSSPLNDSSFALSVAIDDTRAFVAGPREAPIHVFSRDGGTWTHSVDVVSPDSAMRWHPTSMKVRELLFASFLHDRDRGGSVSVFRANSSGRYDEVAKLFSTSTVENSPLGRDMDAYASGSFARVVATGEGGVHVFDLNQVGKTPAPLQEDFEQGNSANWTPIAGSAFSVVTSAGSRVFRQSNTTGDAGAFFTNINWTNQAIEADVKPTAFDGANRWVGLVVRRTDASNYYYLTLRQSNVLELKRMVNGTFVTLASTPVSVVLNRNYRLRLEAVGTRLRAHVNGRLAVETVDRALKQGHAGVQMYRSRADFDNIVLSHNPHRTLLEHRTVNIIEGLWNFPLGSWSPTYLNGHRLVQQDTAGDARAITRIAADDQVVQVAATANSFAAGTGSRWFGVVARYVDANNFYYVTVRRDNTLSLRKLVNGTVQILDTAPLTVSAGTTYTLRLEAIGASLRAYVNGNVVLEATDSSHASGRYGLATYRTAATFDDFIAWEP